MDVQMPDMDGYEATRAIRKTEKGQGRHTPIVAMTAHAIKGDRERCLKAGMDAYLAKPISSGKLLEVLEKIAGGTSEQPAAPPSPAPKEVDAQMLQEAFDQDWDFFKEVLDLFISDYPQMLADLHKTMQNGDAAFFSRKAHALKGMVSLFKAEEAAAIAQHLEALGRHGQLEEARGELDRLTAALERLKTRLLKLSDEHSPTRDSNQTV
jgi:CheY-like chemotaxis protein